MDQQIIPCPFFKRLFDICISLLIITILFPVFVFIWLSMTINMILCREDRGPYFYKEKRISQGNIFEVLKFRTLKTSVIERIHTEGKWARYYESDFSNLTWSGRYILKKFYFDEIPQFFNILKGDMSIVGPRPWALPEVNAQIQKGYLYRNWILAGFTSPAQIQLKGVQYSKEMNFLQLEIQYVERCKTWPSWKLVGFDIYVIIWTIFVMRRGEGLKY